MARLLYDLSFDELSAWLEKRGEPAFRARQIFRWAYVRNASTFEQMTDLPEDLRAALAREFAIGPLPIVRRTRCDEATKLLVDLPEGGRVECVRIRMDRSFTACLSSQVGCAMRCAFCATGEMGYERNLSSGEIVAQLVTLRSLGRRISNVVFMGMGEPLENYANVVAAIRLFTDRRAFQMSPSRVTLSTVGIPALIRRYAAEGLGTELAISLNAPDDHLRRALMPGASRWPLAEVLSAAREYTEATGGQPVTFAYVLIDGVNDHFEHAEALARLLRHQRHHLNIIPYNLVPHSRFLPPSRSWTGAFVHHCRLHGLNVSLRISKGVGILAGCGQLGAEEAMEGARR